MGLLSWDAQYCFSQPCIAKAEQIGCEVSSFLVMAIPWKTCAARHKSEKALKIVHHTSISRKTGVERIGNCEESQQMPSYPGDDESSERKNANKDGGERGAAPLVVAHFFCSMSGGQMKAKGKIHFWTSHNLRGEEGKEREKEKKG